MSTMKSYEYLRMIVEREKSLLRSEQKTWTLIVKSSKISKASIQFDNALTLIDIYSNIIDEKEKDTFINGIAQEIWASPEIYAKSKDGKILPIGSSALGFYTLARLGFSKRAIEHISPRVHNRNCILVFRLILDLLSEDYNYFNIEEYNLLIRIISETNNDSHGHILYLRDEILSRATEIGSKIVKEEIRGVNIEINRDKESVIRKISILGMDDTYEQFLNELDIYINTSSGLVASGMISNFRTFWEQIIIELSRKINVMTREPIPTQEKSTISNSRLYIKNMLELSDADNSLISHFVKVLHSEGGHAFTSNIEYFRLARNIGIEIILLLLSKTELLKKKNTAG